MDMVFTSHMHEGTDAKHVTSSFQPAGTTGADRCALVGLCRASALRA